LRRAAADQTARIHARVRRMIEQGLVEEVRSLLAELPPMARSPRQALGYGEIIGHLEGRWPLEKAIERIKINTRQFAKAQRTWFRRLPDVHWIDLAPDDTAEAVADRLVEQGLWPHRT
jgi:tRNA dimethylallyltransferase